MKKRELTKAERFEVVNDILKDIYTPEQIRLMFKSDWKRGKNWSHEDYTVALTLKHLSRKTYQFLKKKKLLPLPGLTSLDRFFKKFVITEGFSDSVKCLLKTMSESLTPLQRVVAFCFDEVHTRKDISYYPPEDKIVGPHSAANVLMISGIFKKWKIPFSFRFDSALEEKELLDTIIILENMGYHVVSITSDMGTKVIFNN